MSTETVKPYVGVGSIMAMIMSWNVNHSILWALWHGVCSWLYVIYYACGRP